MDIITIFVGCVMYLWLCELVAPVSKPEKVEKEEMDIIKILNLNHSELIKCVDGMSGTEFESFLQRLLEKFGYRAYATAKSGDYGADLIVSKDGLRMVVQAKRYSKSVGIKAVQEALGAVKHYSVSKALVITNSRFTKQACKLAASNDVELWDRGDLFDFILLARKRTEGMSYS